MNYVKEIKVDAVQVKSEDLFDSIQFLYRNNIAFSYDGDYAIPSSIELFNRYGDHLQLKEGHWLVYDGSFVDMFDEVTFHANYKERR